MTLETSLVLLAPAKGTTSDLFANPRDIKGTHVCHKSKILLSARMTAIPDNCQARTAIFRCQGYVRYKQLCDHLHVVSPKPI
jgi:hypothetical protein